VTSGAAAALLQNDTAMISVAKRVIAVRYITLSLPCGEQKRSRPAARPACAATELDTIRVLMRRTLSENHNGKHSVLCIPVNRRFGFASVHCSPFAAWPLSGASRSIWHFAHSQVPPDFFADLIKPVRTSDPSCVSKREFTPFPAHHGPDSADDLALFPHHLSYCVPSPSCFHRRRSFGKYERHRLQALSDLKKGLEQTKTKKLKRK